MLKFDKGVTYPFSVITNHEQENDSVSFSVVGNNEIGEELIVMRQNDIIVSFVLIETTTNMYYYECVYINIQNS